MKKAYIAPALMVQDVNTESLMLGLSSTAASIELEVLGRAQTIDDWDDDEEDEW